MWYMIVLAIIIEQICGLAACIELLPCLAVIAFCKKRKRYC